MLFDLIFFGCPIILILCLGGLAIRDDRPIFWLPALSLLAYCIFYLFGGREVLLYLAAAAIGGSCFL
jgi:hypothetical protein